MRIQDSFMLREIIFIHILLLLGGMEFLFAEEIALDIPRVVENALSNNLALKIEKLSTEISKESLDEFTSAFDPTLHFTGSLKDGDQESQKKYEITHKLSKFFKTGGSASIYVNISHYGISDVYTGTEIDNNDVYTDTDIDNNDFSSYTQLVITQPILKNRGISINTTNIAISENDYKISTLSFQQKVIDIFSEAQHLYWESFAAQERLIASHKSLKLAQKFLDESIEKVKLGDLVPIDTLQAKAEVAQRTEDLILYENELKNSHDELLYFIFGRATHGKKVKLVQKPEFKRIKVDEEKLVREALKRRTEYRIANLNAKNADLNVIYTKNQKLPEVDVNATLGIRGKEDTLGASIEKMTRSDDYEGSVTLSVEFPWGLNKDKAAYMKSRLEKKQIIHKLHETEQEIILDVRSAIRNLLTLERKYAASLLSKKLGEEKLQAEEKKYKHGLSTSYTVLQHQRDLANSTVNNIDALIQYQQAVVRLNKALGLGVEK